jgi:hypothetical protein
MSVGKFQISCGFFLASKVLFVSGKIRKDSLEAKK